MDYKIVEKTAFHIVGVKRRIRTEDNANFKEVPKFWNDVMDDGTFQILSAAAGPLGTMGVITNSNEETGTFDYYIAIEGQELPNTQYVTTEISAGKYAVFTAIGPLPEGIQKAWQQIYSEFFPATPYEHTGAAELEVYLPGDPSQMDYKSEIWIPIK